MKNKLNHFLRAVIILIVVVFSFSAATNRNNDFEISKNLEIFVDLFKELNNNYVDEINPGQLIKTAIDKMLESLDPYTNFIPESEIEDLRLMTTGQYGGVGALIQQRDGHVIISEPYENFPAFKAGIKAGDIILEVNGESAAGKSVSDVSAVLKGFPGSKVVVVVDRVIENKKYTFEIIREDIKINNVPFYKAIDGGIGYIKLTNFAFGASREVKDAMVTMKSESQINSIILDLRGNGGGLLGEAVNIVGLFVPKYTTVVTTKGKLKDSNREYKTQAQPYDTEIPIVVLIDGMSASASEIVAGAIQDFDRGVVIGQQSYGKGLVQNVLQLSYNTRLKVTIAKYYIPSGRCIQSVDYSKRDSLGKATASNDKDKQLFYTKNNRPVYDAGGVIPDITIETGSIAMVTINLVIKHLIFDFATQFTQKYSTIVKASDFVVTDKMYEEFIEFLDDKDYDYETGSERKLKELKEITIEEKYFENIQTEFESLLNKLTHNKQEDLITFRDEIVEFLGSEIISRYYFQKGRIEYSLRFDKELNEAVEVLKTPARYGSLLIVK